MAVIVLGSAHGSPGATTAALALAAHLPGGVLVEADCDGGVLAARLGLAREPGIVSAAADRDSHSAGALLRHAQAGPGALSVVVGPASPANAAWVWQTAGPNLADAVHGHAGWVVIDAGRLSPDAPTHPLLERALTAIVVRPRADELAIVSAGLAATDSTARPRLILVGERPYSAAEVSAELGCSVVGVVADDPRAAGILWEGGSRRVLARSAFARSIRSLAEALTELLTPVALPADDSVVRAS